MLAFGRAAAGPLADELLSRADRAQPLINPSPRVTATTIQLLRLQKRQLRIVRFFDAMLRVLDHPALDRFSAWRVDRLEHSHHAGRIEHIAEDVVMLYVTRQCGLACLELIPKLRRMLG